MKSHTQIMRAFESLGDNCEFGLVQSSVGVDQLGFFRFNNSSTDALLRAIETDFADFELCEELLIEQACNDELIVHIPGYDFRYHTFYKLGDVDVDRLRKQQQTIMRFLANKFRDELQRRDKIFVRTAAKASLSDMRAIHAALGRDGPVTMLWVSSAEGDAECGSVEVLAPGLLRAHVDRLNLFEDARAASFDWFEICDKALALSSGVEPVTQRAELPDPRRAHRVLPLSALAEAVAGGAILRAAILHGDGIVTVGDAAVAETLPPDCVRGGQIELPVGRADARLDTGYYLFASDADCESDWLAVLDVRYNREAYDWFAREISPLAKPILLLPDRMDFDALSALRVLAARPVPRLPIPIGRRASVQVLYVPQRPRD